MNVNPATRVKDNNGSLILLAQRGKKINFPQWNYTGYINHSRAELMFRRKRQTNKGHYSYFFFPRLYMFQLVSVWQFLFIWLGFCFVWVMFVF